MKVNPLISVIISIYNKGPYLKECLDSVLSQSYKNIEVICIDDGSTDNSVSIVEDIIKKDNRVSLYKSKHNGPSKARNIGIEHCKGDYIHFVDADDLIKPGSYELLVNQLNESNKDVDMISFYFEMFVNGNDISKTINKENNFINRYGDINHKILSLSIDPFFVIDNVGGGQCVSEKLLKREIMVKHELRFDEDVNLNEDVDFFYHYLMFCKFVLATPFKIYSYRKHISSLSNVRPNLSGLENCIFKIYDKYKDFYLNYSEEVKIVFIENILCTAYGDYQLIDNHNIRLESNALFCDFLKNNINVANKLRHYDNIKKMLKYNRDSLISNINYVVKFEEEHRKYEEEKKSRENLYNSETFKIGKIVVYPFRLTKKIIKKIIKR